MERPAVRRFDTIDLLRGFSILSVVLLHAKIALSTAHPRLGESLPSPLRYLLFNNGGNGVSMFFSISGFLITLISIRRFGSLGRMQIGRFYRIRFARIAPPLLLLLVVLSVLDLACVPRFYIRPSVCSLPRALFAALTFHLNWLEAVRGWLPPCWTVLWSLSVEEMFYLAFPLLCVLLLRRGRRGPAAFAALLSCLCVAGPIARTPWYTTNDIWGYQSYLGNMDGIALGCLCALLANRWSRNARLVRSRWPAALQWCGAAPVLLIAEWPWPKVVLGWHVKHDLGRTGTDTTVLCVGTCLILLGSALREQNGSGWTAPVRWLGRHSYEIYLSHEFAVLGVALLFARVHRGPIAFWIAGMVVLAALLGWGVARWIAEPLNGALRGAPVPSQLQPSLH